MQSILKINNNIDINKKLIFNKNKRLNINIKTKIKDNNIPKFIIKIIN